MSIARATAKVSALTAGGYLISLAVQVLFARRFGTGWATDAWFAASAVPNFLAIVLFASLAKACVPVFVDRLALGEGPARRTMTRTAGITLLALLLLAGVVAALAGPISRLLFPGFPARTLALAEDLLVLSVCAVPGVGTSLVLMAWLQARRRFGPAAISGLFPPFGTLAGILLIVPHRPERSAVDGMAIGLAGGAALQAVFLAIFVLRPHRTPRPDRDPGVRRILRTTLPLLAAAGLLALYPILEKRFASGLPQGAVAWLGFARRPLNLLLVLVAVPAATTSFTALSESAARRDPEELRSRAWRAAVILFLVLLPAALFFGVFAEEILAVLYQRGAFAAADTAAAAAALRLLLPVALLGSAGNLLAHAFLARRKVGAPLVTALSGVLLYVASGSWVAAHWGYRGLAVLQSAALALTVLLVLLWLLRDLGAPRGEGVVVSLLQVAAAGAACGGCLLATRGILDLAASGAVLRILLLGVPAAVGGAVYLGVLALLRNRHLAEVIVGLRGRGAA